MKILYVVSNADLHPNANTGYGRHIREIVDHLHKLGADVEVYAAKTNNIVWE